MDEAAPLEVVTGEVIKRSIIKTIWSSLVLVLTFVLGIFLLVGWWTGATVMRFGMPHGISWLGAGLGLLCIVVAPVLLYFLVARLMANERLIIADDRLQIVRTRGGYDMVCVQLPFANIHQLALQKRDTEHLIGFDLADLDDADTYIEGEDLAANKEIHGWHYVLEGGYQTGILALHKQLKAVIKPRRSKRSK